MFCDEALDAIEAIAAGELTPDGRIAEHLTSCPNCAATLEDARALERMLQARPTPRTPPQFTSKTMARVRRARWRSEQFLDVGFNLAIGGVVLAVLAGVWMLMHRSGLTSVSNDAVDLFTSEIVTLARRAAPSLPVYGGAFALLASALAVWWWAERDVTL
jgi:predicted anti-sigma-YlaC factor YlaD